MARTRIDWTDHELVVLYKGAKELWEGPGGKNKSLIELVRLAQIALPENRRRKHMQGPTNVPKELRAQLFKEGIGKVTSRATAAFASVDKPKSKEELRIEQLANERDAALQLAAEQEQRANSLQAELNAYRNMPPPPTALEVLKGFIADIAADVVARQNMVQGLRMQPVQPPPAPKHDPYGPLEERPRKPRVAVLGPVGQQRTELERDFGERLDLRVFGSDELSRANGMVAGCDLVLGWVKFMDHAARRRLEGPNFRPVNTMFALREELEKVAGKG